MTKQITSLQNPLVKTILDLQQKSSARRSTSLFVAEGRREVSLAISNGYKMEFVIICPEIYNPDPSYPIALDRIPKGQLIEVTPKVYNKIAYRQSTEGIITIAHSKTVGLCDINTSGQPFFIVLEGVEKPGNLGAILRTADAAGVAALVLCDSKTDIYNPNSIRSSLGCTFTVPIVSCSPKEAIDWFKKSKIIIHAATLDTSTLYTDVDLTKPTAIAFGAENLGLSPIWSESADLKIKIPMKGMIDSLNVSASVAVISYEALRQKGL